MPGIRKGAKVNDGPPTGAADIRAIVSGAHRDPFSILGVQEMGGRPDSTILGFRGKAPPAWAAFVNGGLGHMLDYDDVGAGHPSIATLFPALAVAEKRGGVSGRELLVALACGMEIMTRIDDAITIPDWTAAEGWFATQLFGFVAGAASATVVHPVTVE